MPAWLWVVWFVAGLVAGAAGGSGLLLSGMWRLEERLPGSEHGTTAAKTMVAMVAGLGVVAVILWFAAASLPPPLTAVARGFITGSWLLYSLYTLQVAMWAALSYDG
jgi:hypothetical protein